jgi:PAS domain S-box-containing protein
MLNPESAVLIVNQCFISKRSMKSDMIKKYAAFLLPALLAVILGAYFFIADTYLLTHEFEPPLLMPLLNVLFLGVSSFGVTVLAAGSFRRTGRLNLVLLGGGALVFGSATIVSGWSVHLAGGVNNVVTIFSCGVLLTGILYFASTIADFMDVAPQKDPARRWRILRIGYGGAGLAMALIVAAALFHWMPVFFVQHAGPSMARQIVLGVSIILLLYAGFYLAVLYFKSRTDFFFWHALGFLFMAEGLFGEMLTETVGGIINWTGRLALYTGGICLLTAVIGIFRKRSPQEVLGAVFTKPRELHASLFENSLEGILLARRDGMILDANAAACRLLGYSSDQIRNRVLKDLFHPQSAGLAAFRGELAVHAQARAELALRHKDGQLVEVDITSAFFDDPLGERLEVLSFQDIGERKRAEARLRESEQRWAVTLASIGDAVIASDTGARIVFMNKTAEALTGWRMDEAEGKLVREVFRIANEYTGETVPDPASKVLENGLIVGLGNHTVLFRKDGGQVPIDDSGAPIRDDQGRILGVVLIFRDISARRRAEDLLRRSEGRLLAVLEQLPLGVGLLDRDGQIVLGNSVLRSYMPRRLPSRDPERIKRWQAFDVEGRPLPPDQWPGGRALRGETVGTGVEFLYTGEKGRQSWMLESAVPFQAADEGQIGAIAVFQDITERKRSQQALRTSEERYRTLFESIDEGFCVIEMLFDAGGKPVDYRFLEVNPAFERQTGLYNAVGRRMRELAPQHEAYWFDIYGRIALTGEPERFMHEARQLGRWFDVYAFRIGLPQERNVAVLFEDITEKRRIEEQLHTALADAEEGRRLLEAMMEHIPLGIAIADAPDVRIRAVSRAGSELAGEPREQIEGVPFDQHTERRQIFWPDGVTPADNQALPLTRAIQGELVENEEWVIGHPDGTRIPILCTAAPIRDAQGNITGGVVGWQDITERKRMEESLRQLNATLEQQVAERTQLAETRARQLQALAVELIEAEERERRRISQLLHEDLQQMIAAAKLQLEAYQLDAHPDPILSGVQELLEQSIGKSRRLSHELSPTVLDHSGLAAALSWLVRHMQEQFGLQVDLEADPEQRCSVALKIFVFRATQELLFNVVKHSGVKTARIGLSCSGRRLSISVRDHGRGFDPGILNSFDTGHGFGLLSLRERARYIGGGLDIQSAPGRGSRITLTVPIKPIPSEGVAAVSEIGRPQDILTALKQSTQAKGIRVMFVDDHQIMRQGLVRLITGQPDIVLVGEAANGREAVDLAQHLRPDVVLMDISMPEMDGIEATRRIKALNPDVRVVGLSMHEDDQLSKAMVQAGAEAFVSKTASPAELLKAIYGIDAPMPGGKSPSRNGVNA